MKVIKISLIVFIFFCWLCSFYWLMPWFLEVMFKATQEISALFILIPVILGLSIVFSIIFSVVLVIFLVGRLE
jgi:hypothetical protein